MRDTEAMLGNASPRNPSEKMCCKSFSEDSLLVAWRDRASCKSSFSMPLPSSATIHAPGATPIRFHADIQRAGVQAVFEQFLEHGCRPLHHLPGGDLIDQIGIQRADPWRWAMHQPAGIFSFCPMRTVFVLILLARFIEAMLTR